MFCSNICVCVRIRGHRINSIKLRWFWNSVKPRTFCLDHLDPLLIRLGARLLTILPRRWPAEHPSLPCSRSQVWPRMTTATQSMSSESSACSQVFNLAQWHNGTMIPDSTTIPGPSHKIHKDSRPPRLSATRVRMPPTLGIQYDTMDVHDSKELWPIMVNYDQLCCISQNCCVYISICRAAPHPMGCPCFFVRIPLMWAIWTNQSWPIIVSGPWPLEDS